MSPNGDSNFILTQCEFSVDFSFLISLRASQLDAIYYILNNTGQHAKLYGSRSKLLSTDSASYWVLMKRWCALVGKVKTTSQVLYAGATMQENEESFFTLTVKILELDLGLLWRLSIVGHVKRPYRVPWAMRP